MPSSRIFLVAIFVLGCTEVEIGPSGGGGSSADGGRSGGAPSDGGSADEGGAPGCDYQDFVDVVWVDPKHIGNSPIGQCVALPLTAAADGSVSCIVIEARPDMPAGCTAQNRAPARVELLAAVTASEAFDPSWTSICELSQLTGAAREECIAELDSSAPGFCYLANDAVTIGNPELTAYCKPPRQLLKLSGDVLAPEVFTFFFCDDAPPPCAD